MITGFALSQLNNRMGLIILGKSIETPTIRSSNHPITGTLTAEIEGRI